jgi:L-threonylcarbamoyladenylate synthase
MQTLWLTNDPADVGQAAHLLRQGAVVAFPTETVYGLGADIFLPAAIAQIYAAKGRPSDNPLIAHVTDRAMAATIADYLPPAFDQLVRRCWPGPLTLVVPKKSTVPDIGLATIGIRCPQHPLALALIAAVGHPLVAPSANLSGRPSPTTAAHVRADLDGKIAAILDGGPCLVGIESTILDLTTPVPTILRPGAITAADISAVLGVPVAMAEHDDQSANIPKAPGMKYRHYAPTVPVYIYADWASALTLDPQLLHQALVLSNLTPPLSINLTPLPLNTTDLFARFREAELTNKSAIVVVLDPTIRLQAGLMNRLAKAAQPN